MVFWKGMENRKFSLDNHDVEARLRRLDAAKAGALEQALDGLSKSPGGLKGKRDRLPEFLLPLAEFGLSSQQILAMAAKLPDDFDLDHREIYFDFRLDRWIRHIEPPTLSDCLEEYLESAQTPAEGIAYLREQWQAFLKRHGAE
ncbi:MAG: hypothetical protein JWO30_3504 [Fibrobacteres bacterium]|nr:hypothetical protein [Fibrobacterota bacterium]